jgi:hypothetical protein
MHIGKAPSEGVVPHINLAQKIPLISAGYHQNSEPTNFKTPTAAAFSGGHFPGGHIRVDNLPYTKFLPGYTESLSLTCDPG